MVTSLTTWREWTLTWWCPEVAWPALSLLWQHLSSWTQKSKTSAATFSNRALKIIFTKKWIPILDLHKKISKKGKLFFKNAPDNGFACRLTGFLATLKVRYRIRLLLKTWYPATLKTRYLSGHRTLKTRYPAFYIYFQKQHIIIFHTVRYSGFTNIRPEIRLANFGIRPNKKVQNLAGQKSSESLLVVFLKLKQIPESN